VNVDPAPGNVASRDVPPVRRTDLTAARVGTSWPPTPVAQTSMAPFGFASASDRRGLSHRVEQESSPTPGRLAVVMAALMIGLLLMGTQLWLLTVALELYLGGHGRQVWLLALVSGAIFAGGVLMVRQLDRHPRLGR
jgi:uncharacterized protein DUF6755